MLFIDCGDEAEDAGAGQRCYRSSYCTMKPRNICLGRVFADYER